MATWVEVETARPEFAARARQCFEAHQHKTLATVRRDGAPRISGVETAFADGELSFGMMRDSVKALDLYRDPRVALHAGPGAGRGDDVTVAGLAVEVPDPARPGARTYRFRVDVREVVLGGNAGTGAESWHARGAGIS